MIPLETLTSTVSLHARLHAETLARRLRVYKTELNFAPTVGSVMAAISAYGDRVAKVESRRRELSDEGRAAGHRDAEVSLRRALDALEAGEPAVLRKRATAMRTTLLAAGQPAAPKDPVAAMIAAVRHSEIRAALGKLDPLAAQIAHTRGTDEIKAAIETSPLGMLDPSYLDQVVEERARAANPAAWTELEDLQMLEGAAHALISAARVALGPDVDQAPQMIAAVA